MDAARRRQHIAATVAEKGRAEVADLSEALQVSGMTIRRDLELLEEEGLVRRVRGGAVARISSAYEPPYVSRLSKSASAKERIARAATELVLDGDTIVVDTGTTTLEMVRHLRGRRVITVITASLRVAMELSNEPDIRVVMTGGFLRLGELSLVGSLAEEVFRQFNCDSAFIGVGGVHLTKGISDFNPDDARIKRLAIASATRRIVLADATKLDRVAFVNVAAIDGVDTIVTDAAPEHPTVLGLIEAGLTVVHALGEP